MGLGKRRESRQQELWIAADRLARTPRHVFYEKLNRVLAKARFDAWVEERCGAYYAEEGRRSIPPGVYFRMLLVGYFEGIDSQRGIAWRCADSLSLQAFLGYGPTEIDAGPLVAHQDPRAAAGGALRRGVPVRADVGREAQAAFGDGGGRR